MEFLEKDLEQIIFNANNDDLVKRGLKLPRKLKRQVKIGNYGRADLIGMSYDGQGSYELNIIELKQKKISVSAFLQAVGYAKGVSRFFNKRYDNSKGLYHRNYNIKITLIGSEIDTTGSFVFLPSLVYSEHFKLEFYTYNYDVDGIKFTSHNIYNLNVEGF